MKISIEIVEGGYIVTYKKPSMPISKQKVFIKLLEVTQFLEEFVYAVRDEGKE
jgi:hypothetical protein